MVLSHQLAYEKENTLKTLKCYVKQKRFSEICSKFVSKKLEISGYLLRLLIGEGFISNKKYFLLFL